MVVFGNTPFFLIIEAGLLSVDTFLMFGGFFLAFVMLRQEYSGVKYLLAIPQRALRIWPAYTLTMMFYYSLFMQLGGGPFWAGNEVGVDVCSSMWKE